MSVLRLCVAYDGSEFSGFQVQPQVRTVQGALEGALSRIATRDVRVRAAGRTDAGVHALGQVVSIDEPEDLHPEVILRAAPAVLPRDVAIVDAQMGPEGFDARRSALWREYVYLLWCGAAPHPLYRKYAAWSRERLEASRMSEALQVLVGTHDFTSFGRLRSDQNPERTVIEATVVDDGPFVRIRVVAESFLHQMVRSIVGTAMEIGASRKPVDWLGEVLEARDRAAAGPVAVPDGLTLVDVGYDNAALWPRRPAVNWPWSNRVHSRAERCSA